MSFQITALSVEQFAHYFDMDDETLARVGAKRVNADQENAYPCRVSLKDADIDDELILLNFTHMDMASPYRASHAVYVRKGATAAKPAPGNVPDVLSRRLLSIRGFDDQGCMCDGDVIEGTELSNGLEYLFANKKVAFVDIHFAKRGCFGARAFRA